MRGVGFANVGQKGHLRDVIVLAVGAALLSPFYVVAMILLRRAQRVRRR